jgi:hypothetical protein
VTPAEVENCRLNWAWLGVLPVACRTQVAWTVPLPGSDPGTLTWTLTFAGAPLTLAVSPDSATLVRLDNVMVLVWA